ncbi:D-Ala-D-Ala carboxypeptidase family metallohydrolase [Pseudomonas asiatica]|uniref:D-Ala-D-Ala carboxypeptidase family metallohydrolase n=1 Tax=Pseudomonas TaxID=286 RepID=UPI00051D283E|nr:MULTISPECIES: D-Ala-D-Ala carboxypeptidase family metallohydrolase [Pseudomonas]KAF4559878.1 peptidase M15 [Pseudomonas sp. CES]KGK24707.1 peptidase M15 [Pseudomonas plecoglossicida]MBF8806742.1 peptidase M15 [Pseudomonas asiatica]MBH3381323.1 peptidase M15 [Pseudomonas asiatica]MCK2124592.1 D-Ala-D-Ala carboxypeptidase family metallohydrolase [Pseudomonas sp. PNPG3]
MRITPHFTLDEMTVSQLAAREGLDNNPPAEARANLQLLCNALEQVRALFGAPVIVSSGYRSPAVNQRIGGTLTSKHLQGLAADFTVIEVTPREVVRRVSESTIPFDQLILEFDDWVHLAVSRGAPRRQVLTIRKGTGYLPGLQ